MFAYKSKNKNKAQSAEMFGVSETTLREHLKGKPCSWTYANNHTLSSIQEEVLVRQLGNTDKW